VLFSDYGKGVLDDLPALIDIAREARLPTLVDPKKPDPAHYRGAFLVKPNETEFRALFGDCDEAFLVDAARTALSRHEIENIVLTRGPKGMLLIGRDGRAISYPTRALEVFDVSGAGDTVIATLAVAIGKGLSLDEAIHLANVAAGIAVGRMGTHVVTRAELDLALAEQGEGGSKLLALEPLLRLLAAERARGRRIVFTNGCFDILHPGHVRMLAAARAEGDLLVVGLNGDASVRGLKGPTRPVNPFASRAEVLAGLAVVDYVVGFDEPTPAALIEAIAPDVLVKGGDYDSETVVGARFVQERGGRLVLARFHEGHSSTAVIERIADRA
jgi:D-beta-D-heptose 7-phosphate kinase/D-beta-D-heptose 1-phosphate adenosyltransferase